MRYYETQSHVGPNGDLVVKLPPDFSNSDVDVRVEPHANGATPRAMTREQWQEFVRRTGGSIPDFPDMEGRDAQRRRVCAGSGAAN
jgi:hypothetical protein